MTMHPIVQRVRLPYLMVALAVLAAGLGAIAQPVAAGFQEADTTPPVISGVLVGHVGEASGPEGSVVTWAPPTATDDIDGPVPVTCGPDSGATFPVGSTVVACAATDAAGNITTARFEVIIRDTTTPLLRAPDQVTEEATGPSGAIAAFTVTAYDLVDGDFVPTCTPAPNSTFPLGATTVTCQAVDAHGNATIKSFPVYVVDTTAPLLTEMPADLMAPASDPAGAVVAYAPPTATDLVDGPVTPSCAPASDALFPVGLTTVTCAAADAAGNAASASFTVTVTPPPAALTRSGFYAPVTMDGSKVNTVKGGATVPLKFEVFEGGAEVTDPAVVASFAVSPVGCASGALEDPVEFTTTGGTSLRYDAASGQFVQHWRTPKVAGCYRVILAFADGAAEPIVADFQVK